MTTTVTIDQLQKNTRKYVNKAHDQPIEVSDESGRVAVILSIAEYEALYAAAMRRLLASRMKEPTVSHEEVVAGARAIVRRHRKKA